jgi:hypothetical protein
MINLTVQPKIMTVQVAMRPIITTSTYLGGLCSNALCRHYRRQKWFLFSPVLNDFPDSCDTTHIPPYQLYDRTKECPLF